MDFMKKYAKNLPQMPTPSLQETARLSEKLLEDKDG